jgi:hypothetical protein
MPLPDPPADAAEPPCGSSDPSAYHQRLNRQVTACICRECASVDHLPSAALRSVSPLAEFVAGRLEVLGGAG